MAGGKIWTDEEYEYLKNNYFEKEVSEIAKILGRTEMAIKQKACYLGLLKRRAFTEKEDDYILEHEGELSYYRIAKNLKRPVESVRIRAIYLQGEDVPKQAIYSVEVEYQTEFGKTKKEIRHVLAKNPDHAEKRERSLLEGYMKYKNVKIHKVYERRFQIET